MLEIILVVVTLWSIFTHINLKKVKRRLDTLEIVLAKKNLLTWDDPAWNLNDADKRLLNEFDK